MTAIGVFGVDPGGATGLAWGTFNPSRSRSYVETLQSRLNGGSCTISGDVREQIRAIAGIWQSFFRVCVNNGFMKPENIFVVVEDFIYSSGNTYGGEDSAVSTSIIWGLEGYRLGQADLWKESHPDGEMHTPQMILQTASQAKSFATPKRLREFDMWVRGRDHERSAWAHVAYFVTRYQQQRGD